MSAVVDAVASSSVYCAHAEPVPLPALRLFTVAVATWDQKTREGMILLVNRDEHNAHDATIDLTSLPGLGGAAGRHQLADAAQRRYLPHQYGRRAGRRHLAAAIRRA